MRTMAAASTIAALLLLTRISVGADYRSVSKVPDTVGAQRIARALDKKSTASSDDIKLIEAMEANRLNPSTTNISIVMRLLARSADPDVRISLIRLLGSLYTSDNRSGQNAAIIRNLRSDIYNSNRKIAAAAVLVYSRIDYQPDTLEVLDYSLARKILNEREYSQELALNLPTSPPQAQTAIAARLNEKSNPFGAEVLAFGLNSLQAVNGVAPEARKILLTYLRKHEPMMPMALSRIGFVDCFRYANWLDAIATLEASPDVQLRERIISTHLNDEKIDPRKILGYFASPHGQKFSQEASPQALSAATERAKAFVKQFPGNEMFSLLVQALPE